MSAWQPCLLGDILTLQRGFDITKALQQPGDVPVVSSSGTNSFHDQPMVAGPGVVIGRKGTLGTCFYLNRSFWPHDTTLWIKDFKGNDPKFCYYFLRSMDLAKYDVGAANPSLNRNQVHLLPVFKVPLPDQRRIASILGAYDDLIETNRQRVALLEDMARGLFEEWFVRFRFPGWEGVEMMDLTDGSLPEGWERVPFSRLAEFANGFAFKPSDFENVGLPIVKIPELKNGISDKTPRNSGDRVPPHLQIKTGDLLFSWSGTFAISEWTGGPALLNQHLFVVTPKSQAERGFLREALRSALPRFDLQSVGATMKHIRRSALDTVRTAVPRDDAIMKKANDAFHGFYSQMVNLRCQNSALAASRDLLLPRLISGELSVAAAERGLLQAA